MIDNESYLSIKPHERGLMFMKKVFQKVFSAILLTALLFTQLAGCAKSEPKTDAKTGTQAGTKEASTVEAAAKKKPTLKYLGYYISDDYNKYPVAKVLEEKTGYHVEYDMLPQSNSNDKLNLIFASGEPYDLITMYGSSAQKALYSDYASRGALVDLTGYMDQYGNNIKNSVSQESLDAFKVNNKIYAVPTKAISHVRENLIIREDWLTKLNVSAPKTIDDLVAVLKVFKEKDPGGNGADKNIPLLINATVSNAGNQWATNIQGAFGIPNIWNDVNGKLTPLPLDPAFKEFLVFMTDLYKQGLIDKEFPTNKAETKKAKITSGQVGIAPVPWADASGIFTTIEKTKPEAKLIYLDPISGKNGKSGISLFQGFDRITFIPTSSKNPVDAFKWMNAKLEKDTFREFTIGVEGVHYTLKDGNYTPILPIFNDERNQATNYLSGIDEKLYPIYWQARVRKDPLLFKAYEAMNIKLPKTIQKPDVLGIAPSIADFAKYNEQLDTMINEYLVKVIVGGENISGYDAFVQKWKAAGGEASYNAVNKWYETYKK